jgi:hypothetical protein
MRFRTHDLRCRLVLSLPLIRHLPRGAPAEHQVMGRYTFRSAAIMPKALQVENVPPESTLSEEQTDWMIELMKAELVRRQTKLEGDAGEAGRIH